jgi:pimeloyl-ACP methyl ester carboxylesterase
MTLLANAFDSGPTQDQEKIVRVNKWIGEIGAALLVISVALAEDLPPQVPELPTSLDEAIAKERANALPRTALYDAPDTLASTRPGALLRREVGYGYALPTGARAVRFLYHSRNAENKDVATSGVVLVPAGTPPSGGWPVIAWAHGTSGVAQMCAPSLMKDVAYGEEGLMPMVRAGYAVVATDYHGLGTQGPHQYLSKIAQARDTINSIPAAQAAEPSLGRRWVVAGHSQGGMAAWGVAELEQQANDPTYLGAVAVAPAIIVEELAQLSEAPKAVGFYFNYIASAIHARWPGFKPSDMLTGQALARYGDVTSKGCWYYAFASYLDDAEPVRLKAGWGQRPGAKAFFAANGMGEFKVGPMLVISSDGDQSVPLAGVKKAADSACRRGSVLAFRTYPGLDHDPLMTHSTPDQLAWITERFSGKPAPSDCGQ